ncbi:MAG: hypothetical protein RLZZ53_1197 [Acidobacteriota bacterium]|jgi:hypothetical protein
MSLYSRDDERTIRQQRLVEDWTKSGLITPEQRAQMQPSLQVDLRRTNLFLRITLFLFAFLIINALAGLVVVFLDNMMSATTLQWLAFGAAIASVLAAQAVVKAYRLYHFGVEEALCAAAVVFLAIAFAQLPGEFSTMLGFAGATVGALVVFVRFNYTYAAVAATLLAPLVVFDNEQSDTFRRLVAFVLLFAIFFIARQRREDHKPDHPADTFGMVQAVAWGGMYVITNLKVSSLLSVPDGYGAVYWTTYVAIWIMPIAGLVGAIRDRHRALLNVNIVLAIVTLLSNKPYLGAESKPWDPILFGVFMLAIAIGVRRWLESGPNGSRAGYVAGRILRSESDTLSLLGSATVLAPGAPAATSDQPASFGGGESGGGGATGKF